MEATTGEVRVGRVWQAKKDKKRFLEILRTGTDGTHVTAVRAKNVDTGVEVEYGLTEFLKKFKPTPCEVKVGQVYRDVQIADRSLRICGQGNKVGEWEAEDTVTKAFALIHVDEIGKLYELVHDVADAAADEAPVETPARAVKVGDVYNDLLTIGRAVRITGPGSQPGDWQAETTDSGALVLFNEKEIGGLYELAPVEIAAGQVWREINPSKVDGTTRDYRILRREKDIDATGPIWWGEELEGDKVVSVDGLELTEREIHEEMTLLSEAPALPPSIEPVRTPADQIADPAPGIQEPTEKLPNVYEELSKRVFCQAKNKEFRLLCPNDDCSGALIIGGDKFTLEHLDERRKAFFEIHGPHLTKGTLFGGESA